MGKHKKTIIKEIKAIIAEHGNFTTADVQADSSPVLNSLGQNTHQLLETFNLHKATAVTYVHETETGEDYIAYEDMNKDLLEEVLFLAEQWETDQLKTEKRISN